MPQRPTIETERLILRPFALEDAARVQLLAGAWEIASVTLNVPHPYEDGMAETWISTHQEQFDAGKLVTLAVTLRESGLLIGAIGLTRHPEFERAEMGYWMGVPYWGQGYCTEAAKAMIRYAFHTLGLHRVCATHLVRNPASGRVMQKAGMTLEGTLRQHVKRWGDYEDLAYYGILANEI